MAHQVLTAFVNVPEWDTLPQLPQRQIYERTFERARFYGSVMALTPKERAEATEAAVARIIQEIAQ